MQLSKVTYMLPRFAEYDLKVTMPLYGNYIMLKMGAYMSVATTYIAKTKHTGQFAYTLYFCVLRTISYSVYMKGHSNLA